MYLDELKSGERQQLLDLGPEMLQLTSCDLEGFDLKSGEHTAISGRPFHRKPASGKKKYL